MNDLSLDTDTQASAPAAWAFDAMGHCSACHMDEHAIRRVAEMFARGTAISIRDYPVCGHTIIYRSVGLWTALVQSGPPPRPHTPEPERLETPASIRRMLFASRTEPPTEGPSAPDA